MRFTAEVDRELATGRSLVESKAWRALAEHHRLIADKNLLQLYADESGRFERFSIDMPGFLFDFSKNLIDETTFKLLMDVARAAGIEAAIPAMFGGEKINWTENRAVLHTALRNRGNKPIYVDGKNVMPEVNAVLGKMQRMANRVGRKQWLGHTEKPITDWVNIGIAPI